MERVRHDSAYLTSVTDHILEYKPAHYHICKLYNMIRQTRSQAAAHINLTAHFLL